MLNGRRTKFDPFWIGPLVVVRISDNKILAQLKNVKTGKLTTWINVEGIKRLRKGNHGNQSSKCVEEKRLIRTQPEYKKLIKFKLTNQPCRIICGYQKEREKRSWT